MAERFWNYIDSLHWVPAFKPGPIQALLRGIGRHLDDTRDDIMTLRDQFVVRTADYSMLEDYAAARGVTRSYYDSDTQWRTRIEECFRWFKLGGRVNGLKAILADYGAPLAEIFNLRAEDTDKWAEFFLKVPLPERTLIKQIYELILTYKPARSKMTRFHVTYGEEAPIKAAAATEYGLTLQFNCDSGV